MSFQDKLKPVETTTPSFKSKLKPIGGPAKLNVPPLDPARASKERFQAAQNDQYALDKEANKGFLSRFGKALVKNIAPSEVGLGKTISGILFQGSKTDKALQSSIASGQDIKVDLIKQISENDKKGIDSTKLRQEYARLSGDLDKTTKTANAFVQLPSTAQAAGQLGGTALDVLTAGTYSKAKTGVMQTGKLFSGGSGAVKTAATAAGVPELGAISGQTARGLFTKQGAKNIATGAGLGYASDVTLGLQGLRGEDRQDANAFIPGFGTALGATIPAISETAQSVKNVQQKGLPFTEKRTIYKRQEALKGLQETYAKVDKAVKAAERKGVNANQVLSETNLLNGAVDADGKINVDKALNNFDEFISPYEGKVRSTLADEGRTVSLDALVDDAKSFIEKSDLSDIQKTELQREIAKNFEAFKQFNGNNVPVTSVHDTKVYLGQNNNYLNPAKDAVDKEAARFFKEVVENNSYAMDVQGHNAELSKYYSIKDVLKSLDRTRVAGGRLGKYFSSVVGGMVGATAGGPLGALAGAEAGARAKGSAMSRALGGQVNKTLQPTERLLNAQKAKATGKAAVADLKIPSKRRRTPDLDLTQSSNKDGNLNTNQSTTIAPTTNAISKNTTTKNASVQLTVSDFFEEAPKKSLMDSLKDQGGYARNPLGRGETDLQRLGRLRESSAKVNRLKPAALDVMEEFIDYQQGGQAMTRVRDPKVLNQHVQVIAKELGITGNNREIAKKFREILDSRQNERVRRARRITPRRT